MGIDTTFGELVQEGGKAYRSKNFRRAADFFSRALAMRPDQKNAYLLYDARALASEELRDYQAAAADWEKAKQLKPRAASVLNSLAWLRATCPDAALRDGQRAIRDATRACELTGWKQPAYVDTLAAAYAEAGQFEVRFRSAP